MTKHLRFSLIALLLLAVPGAKADFVADGLHYNLNSDGTATVIANSDYKNMRLVLLGLRDADKHQHCQLGDHAGQQLLPLLLKPDERGPAELVD